MNKIVESALSKVVFPIVLSVFTPSAVLVGSKISTGDWMNWLHNIPIKIFVWFGIVILVWVICALLFQRYKTITALNQGCSPLIGAIPRWGYIEVMELNYSDVVWKILTPDLPPLRNIGQPRLDELKWKSLLDVRSVVPRLKKVIAFLAATNGVVFRVVSRKQIKRVCTGKQNTLRKLLNVR